MPTHRTEHLGYFIDFDDTQGRFYVTDADGNFPDRTEGRGPYRFGFHTRYAAHIFITRMLPEVLLKFALNCLAAVIGAIILLYLGAFVLGFLDGFLN